MDYKWAKDFTLQLLDQYSTAGGEVPLSYNCQADRVLRIPKLLDEAGMHVATTVRRIRTMVPIADLSGVKRGAWTVFELPEDCCQVMSGALVAYEDQKVRRYNAYHLLDQGHMAVHRDVPGDVYLEYYRRPRLLGEQPEDSATLDNVPEVQMILPYYAAAHLAMYDNAFACRMLMNEWETRLARLAEMPKTEPVGIYDAYSEAGDDWGFDG